MLIIITIVVVYGLLLTLSPGENPYINLLNNEINLQEVHLGSDEGRLFGAISSVFVHPMSFGVMLGFSFFYILFVKNNMGMRPMFFYILSIMILMATMFCGVRSSLAALMGTGVVYLLIKRQSKLTVTVLALVGIALVLLNYIPILDTYVSSIFQLDSENVDGSSINQRLEQLAASLFEIRDNPAFGNGFAWHSYYIWKNGGYGHPLLHGWESLIFVALTDSGYAGVIVWIVFVIYFCLKFKNIGLICLFAYFMLYRIATGTFGEEMFYIFLVLLLCTQKLQSYQQLIINRKKI